MVNTKCKKKNKTRKLTARLVTMCVFFTLALFAIALYIASRHNPEFVYKYYTSIVFKYISLPIKYLLNLIPFSVSELVLYALIFYALVFIIYSIVKTIKNLHTDRPQPFYELFKYLINIVSIISVLVFLFIIFGGLNYSSLTFYEITDLQIEETHISKLEALCDMLGEKAAYYRQFLKKDDNNCIEPDVNLFELLESADEGYEFLSDKYPNFKGYYVKPKPAILSVLMCYTQITGIYPYMLPEPVINFKTPISDLPHTICHELAHARGFAREDEANFLGFLAAINNTDYVFVYSGYYTAFCYSMNALYDFDKDAWNRVAQKTDEGIFNEMRSSNEFWDNFKTPNDVIASVAKEVNDTYLQVQNVDDGINSYGRMVDLLLSYYSDSINQ